jgi:hypothetical protein
MYLGGDRIGPKFQRSVFRQGELVRDAARAAAVDAAFEIQQRGAADIAGSGKFGSRWTEGLHETVTEGGGNIRIAVTHDIAFWPVFEFGATIKGKPLLWIPMSFADDAQGVSAKDYPGVLFRVDRKSDGLPLLLAASGVKGEPAQVKYFAKSQVVIPRKWHLRDIVRDVARHMGQLYRARFTNRG